jgi:uncharacterized protein (DUF305 family)
MCNKAPVSDVKIRDLCKSIIASQQGEIDQMTAMLKSLQQ